MFLEFFIRALSEGLEVIWLKRTRHTSPFCVIYTLLDKPGHMIFV